MAKAAKKATDSVVKCIFGVVIDSKDELLIIRNVLHKISLSTQCFPIPLTIMFNECDLRCVVVGPW